MNRPKKPENYVSACSELDLDVGTAGELCLNVIYGEVGKELNLRA